MTYLCYQYDIICEAYLYFANFQLISRTRGRERGPATGQELVSSPDPLGVGDERKYIFLDYTNPSSEGLVDFAAL
jgi:hypothetical protein